MSRLASAVYLAQPGSVFGWSFVVIALVAVGFVAVTWLRRWMKEDDIPTGGTGFGLGELRQMHARGELTDAEYERARAKMAAAAKSVTADMPDPAGGRRAPGAAGGQPGTAGPTDGPIPKRPRP